MGNGESSAGGDRSARRGAGRSSIPDEEGFEPPQDEQSASYWSQFKDSYEEIIESIIRPPRVEYDDHQLGPREFELGGRRFARHDFTVTNRRGLKLCCSHWHLDEAGAVGQGEARPVSAHASLATSQPCMIYLHSHVASRLDAVPLLRTLLGAGVSVLSFDFAGHGQSEGEYVSLGWFERDDVDDLIQHMRAKGHEGTLGLWGHYTGAVAALLHGDRDPTIGCLVLEGAVADIRQLVAEWVAKGREQGYVVPQVLVSAALRLIRRTVRQRADFDAFQLKPIDKVGQCFIPALFVVASEDPVVEGHHGRALHAAYAGDKNIIESPGDNLSGRSQFLLDSASIFVTNALRVPPDFALDASAAGLAAEAGLATRLLNSPPWVASRHARSAYGAAATGAGTAAGGLNEAGTVVIDPYGGTAVWGGADAAVMPDALLSAEAAEDAMLARALALSMQEHDQEAGGDDSARGDGPHGRHTAVDGDADVEREPGRAAPADWAAGGAPMSRAAGGLRAARAADALGVVEGASPGGAEEEEVQKAIALSLLDMRQQQ